MTDIQLANQSTTVAMTWRDYLTLCKPKIISLIVFTAIVGMFLSTPGMIPLSALIYGSIGIGLAAASAAAINHVVDYKIDSIMARTPAAREYQHTWRGDIRFFSRHLVHDYPDVSGKYLNGRAHRRVIDRLWFHLFHVSQTCDTTKYCHWRCRWCCTTRAGLDSGYREPRTECVVVVFDHLCLDTTTLLVTGHIPL